MRDVAARGLSAQRRATFGLLRALPPDAWDAPCLPPWRVRDVVAHLLSVDEAAVTGRLLPILRTHGRVEIEAWNDREVAALAGLAPPELLDRLERSGTRLAAIAGRLPRITARIPVNTAFGRLPAPVLLCRRVVDEWVHSTDIAASTGRPAALAPEVAEALAVGVLETLPALVLPRLDLRAGVVRLVVAIHGGHDEHGVRRTWGIDFARRQYGPRVTVPPDAVIRVDVATLTLVTEGRRGEDDRDAVAVEGDEALARAVLRGLEPERRWR